MTLIVDAGPLVALLHADDKEHAWAVEAMRGARPPLLTCDAVMSEACFLLERARGGAAARVIGLAQQKVIAPSFRSAGEIEAIGRLMRRYAEVPMSFADACLVRMAELAPAASILTLDRDFRVYRRNGRSAIRVIAPWSA